MSRKINVGGNNITFPDRYVKLIYIEKITSSLSANTDGTISFITDLQNKGYAQSDIIMGWLTGYTPGNTWTGSIFYPKGIISSSDGLLYYRNVGTTAQTYTLRVIIAVKDTAINTY